MAPAAFVPHLELLASRVQQALTAQQLRLGERNVLAEALLAAAVGTDETVMAQVLEWVLAGVRSDWTSAAFLSSLANPGSFVATYIHAQMDVQGNWEVCGGVCGVLLCCHVCFCPSCLFLAIMFVSAHQSISVYAMYPSVHAMYTHTSLYPTHAHTIHTPRTPVNTLTHSHTGGGT